jgi:hypothetical protein
LLRHRSDSTKRYPKYTRSYYEEAAEGGRTIWVSFDWAVGVDLEEALQRQRKLTSYVADRQLVVDLKPVFRSGLSVKLDQS